MNLLLIGPLPDPVNGCSLANQVLVKQLSKDKSINISVINTNTKNISSQKVGKFSFEKLFSFVSHYKKVFWVTKADIVYTTPGQTFLGISKYIPFYLICRFFSIPYVIHVHGNHLGNEYKSLQGLKKQFFGYFIRHASTGIVLSESLRDNFKDLLPPEKVFIAENFAPDELLQATGLTKNTSSLRIFYLSNLMKEKGIFDVLESLKRLSEMGITYTADIAGKIEDDLQDEILQKLSPLKDYVTYHGVVHGETKVSLLKNANVFIMPTYYRMEGQPIAIIEAMATGNVIISTAHSGIPDIMSDKNGFFVRPQNPDDIVKVLSLLGENLSVYVDLISNHNAAYAGSRFTEKRFAQTVEKILRATIKNPK